MVQFNVFLGKSELDHISFTPVHFISFFSVSVVSYFLPRDASAERGNATVSRLSDVAV